LGEGDAVDRDAVDEDAAALGLVEAHEEVDERGFSGACVADDGDALAGFDGEGDVLEHPGGTGIGRAGRGGVGRPLRGRRETAVFDGGSRRRWRGAGGGAFRAAGGAAFGGGEGGLALLAADGTVASVGGGRVREPNVLELDPAR